jgi:hypothetical protein
MCFYLLAEVHGWHQAYLSESSMKELIMIGNLFFSSRGVLLFYMLVDWLLCYQIINTNTFIIIRTKFF